MWCAEKRVKESAGAMSGGAKGGTGFHVQNLLA